MYNEEEIEDSLEFCQTAKEYYGPFFDKKEEQYVRQKTNSALLDAEFSKPHKDKGWRRPTSESTGLRTVNNLFVLVVCVLLAYVIASAVTHYVAHQTWVEGDSMEPTLSDGDSIIIQKLSYYFRNPGRYDVVVFPVTATDQNGNDIDTYYVKRVIGLPGETVQIVDGKVQIDGKELKDDKYCLSKILDSGNAAEPVTLGEDEYFVLGDNRNMSTDSRSDFVGLVRRDDIVGEVFMRIWPFSHWGIIPGAISFLVR
jgi:signal peptidase I